MSAALAAPKGAAISSAETAILLMTLGFMMALPEKRTSRNHGTLCLVHRFVRSENNFFHRFSPDLLHSGYGEYSKVFFAACSMT
jgi:hypothetical protein